MACCSQSTCNNGNCGRSSSRISIPQNALANPIVCDLPCVREYSTSIARFNNQIIKQVLTALSRRCEALTPPVVVPPGAIVVLSNTTNLDQSLTTTINLSIPATQIISVNTSLQNIKFEITGFASAIVQVTGEVVVTVTYLAVDGTTQTQTRVVPFAFTIVVPGDFPTNVIVQGMLAIPDHLVTFEIDPSTLEIIFVTITIFFAANIQIILPT
jgi:hypothetical protein